MIAAQYSQDACERGQFLNLGGAEAAADLAHLISRARSVDPQARVRLLARGSLLATYVCVLAPQTLLETTPTVLGMRALYLAQPAYLDRVVEGAALLDRLARIEKNNFLLSLPPATVKAAWAGVTPPERGWQEQEALPLSLLFAAAKAGMEAVEAALPAQPGWAVTQTIRNRIWSSPLEALAPAASSEAAAGARVPAGAAFAAVVLGFLGPKQQGSLRQFAQGNWRRLNAPAGYVLFRDSRLGS